MKQFFQRLISSQSDLPKPQQVWFLHLPKTGGTTFRNILENHYSVDEIYPDFAIEESSRISLDTLRRYRLVRGHFPYREFIKFAPRQTPYVTMLRDPLKRLESSYFHWKRRFPELFEDDRGFKQFIKGEICDLDGSIIRDGQNAQTKALTSTIQVFDAKFPSEELQQRYFESALITLRNSLFVGITERFQESLELLCYTLKLCPRLIEDYPILHQNKGEKKSASEMLSAEDFETLKQNNSEDFKLYQAALEIFRQRYRAMENHLRASYGTQLSVFEMLNRHYNALYSLQPVPDLRYTFDQPLAGKGWHKRQEVDSTWFRWTASPVATLELPVTKTRDAFLKIVIFRTKRIKPLILDSLNIVIHGHAIPCSQNKSARSIVLTGRVSKSILQDTSNPFVTIEIHTDKVDFPIDSDKRKVGVAVQSVEFSRNSSQIML